MFGGIGVAGVWGKSSRGERASIWLLLIGLIMIAMGGYVWYNPADAILALAFYFGVVFIMTGAGYLLSLFSGWSGWILAQGLLDVFIGIIFLINIGVTAISIPIMFAFWALFVGVIRIMAAFQLKSSGASHWFWALLSGFLGILFAFLIISSPIIGMITITMFMGTYMILYGFLAIAEYFAGR